MGNFIMIAVISLLAGAALGALLTRYLHPESKERRELEDKLKAVEDDYKTYQQEVAEHFVKTSELINQLTQSYRDVHEHLAASAVQLANPEISRQLLDAGSGRLGTLRQSQTSGLVGHAPKPPKDYAPKVPGGVLSEEYGLKEDSGLNIAPPVRVANDSPEVDAEDSDDEDPTLRVG